MNSLHVDTADKIAFSVLTLLVGCQEQYLVRKKLSVEALE